MQDNLFPIKMVFYFVRDNVEQNLNKTLVKCTNKIQLNIIIGIQDPIQNVHGHQSSLPKAQVSIKQFFFKIEVKCTYSEMHIT